MKPIYFFLVFCTLFTSCQEVIEPDLGETQNLIAIEGLVTNTPGPYFIKITKTKSYYANTTPPPVETATVIISDNEGNTDTLRHTGNGIYATSKIEGKVGNVYTLKVTSEGKTYVSSQPMLQVTQFTGSEYTHYEKRDIFHDTGYYAVLYAAEPQETKDFYLWKFYRNGKLLGKSRDLNIANDEGVKGGIVNLEVPYTFELGDTVRAEMFSLTEDAFNFYNGLDANIHNDGGFFSSPPANPKSNISNGALGMFQVSAVDDIELIIK